MKRERPSASKKSGFFMSINTPDGNVTTLPQGEADGRGSQGFNFLERIYD